MAFNSARLRGYRIFYALAVFWYEKGVNAGDLTSGYYLGLLYKQGLGVDQDYEKAAEYFASVAASENKSATGVVDAGYELAQLYEQGLGVEQDVDRAIVLYQEAAEYGNEQAMEALERLQLKYSPCQGQSNIAPLKTAVKDGRL